MNRRFLGSALALLFFLIGSLVAQEKDPLPVESLLAGPDHADLPWKVQFLEPMLMYQQQYVLDIRARIPAELMDSVPNGVLHFGAKVADADGHWLPGIQYNKFEAVAKLGKSKDIECALAIYLRPGEYTIAMVAFESTTRKSNIVRTHVVIPTLQKDPLPELNEHLPAVEYPSEFPSDELTRTDKSYGELFQIGTQVSPLPVAVPTTTRIDIVLNVSKQPPPSTDPLQLPDRDYDIYFPGRRSRRPSYRLQRIIPHGLAIGRVLQTSSVLSRFAVSDGCVLVSAVDPLHVRTVHPPKPASSIDWPEFQSGIEKLDQNTIDAKVLQDHKAPGRYLHDYLEKLSSEASCVDKPATTHVVIVVGTALDLPEFNKDMRLSGAAAERARFYYFVPDANSAYPDDINKILKSSKTRRFDFTTPEELRSRIAQLIRDLKSPKH